MSVIAKLKAVLSVDSTKFDRGLSKADVNSKRFGKNLQKTMKKAGAAIGGFVTGAVGALALMTKSALSSIDAQAKLARSLGISNEQFQAMALVSEEAGVSQEGLGNAIRKSQTAIQNAERGLMTYVRGFEELGIKTKDLIGLSPDQQFEKLAVALGGLTDKTKQITIAQELFGRQGLSILNMLDNYSEKVDEARAFNDKFGLSISSIDSSKVEEANDAFARVKTAVGGLGNVLAVYFAPILTAISNGFTQGGVDAQTFGNAVASGMKVAGGAIDIVRMAINGMKLVFNTALASISSGITKASVLIYDMSVQISNAFSQIGVSIPTADKILEVGYAAKIMGDNAQEGFNKALAAGQNFEKTIDKISRIQEKAAKRAQAGTKAPAIGGIDLPTETGGQAGKKAKDTTDKVKDLKKEMTEAEKKAKEFGDTMGSSFSNAFQQIQQGENVFKSLANAAVSALQDIANAALKDSLSGLFGTIGKSIFGSIGGASIPSNATGNSYVNKDTITRVHRGEAIVPAQQVNKMGSGESPTYNIDARGADMGVEQRIRSVMGEVDKLRKDIPKMSVSSVKDANNRNLGLLR